MNLLRLLLLLFVPSLWAQTEMEAESELLAAIPIGSGLNQANIYMGPDGYFSPKGPLVTREGALVFLPNDSNEKIQVFENGEFLDKPVPTDFPIAEVTNRQFNSFGGLTMTGSSDQLIAGSDQLFYYDYYLKTGEYLNAGSSLAAPFGALLFSRTLKMWLAVVLDLKYPRADFAVIRESEVKELVPTQPGGFRIGADGLLYRGEFRWSPPKDWGDYAGKLLSGHDIWLAGGSPNGSRRKALITNSLGEVEIELVFPWGERGNWSLPSGGHPFDLGTGPWGEFYCLIAPAWNGAENIRYRLPPDAEAQLVVVRNHLRKFGRLNKGGVNLLQDPTTKGQILGTYPAKTGFRILWKGGQEETIGGQTNVWYQVRLLDGKVGYVFGAFVQNLYDGPNGQPPPWPNVPDW